MYRPSNPEVERWYSTAYGAVSRRLVDGTREPKRIIQIGDVLMVDNESARFVIRDFENRRDYDYIQRISSLTIAGIPNDAVLSEKNAIKDEFIVKILGFDPYTHFDIDGSEPSGQAFRTAMYHLLISLSLHESPGQMADYLNHKLTDSVVKWLTTKYVTKSSGMLHPFDFTRSGVISMFPPMLDLAYTLATSGRIPE